MSWLNELSILIVTWNGDALLRDCLRSVASSCGALPEIVVVDNANKASTREIVSEHSNARYVASARNLGFAGGNNLGFPYCTRQYVLLLNNDTIITKEPFTQMIEYFLEHPNVAVVQGKMRLPRFGNVLDSCGELLTPFGVGYDEFVRRDCASTAVKSGSVYFAKGALLMLRRSAVEEAGGFLFHDFFQNNYEEADFCFRVWMSGREVHFVDTLPIDHLQGQSIRKLDHSEMAGRSLANMWFSLSANLEPNSRRRILPRLFLLQLLLCAVMIASCRWKDVKPFLVALHEIRRRRPLLSAVRRKVQSFRKCSDHEIFEKIMVRPKLSYYYYLFRGESQKYTVHYSAQRLKWGKK